MEEDQFDNLINTALKQAAYILDIGVNTQKILKPPFGTGSPENLLSSARSNDEKIVKLLQEIYAQNVLTNTLMASHIAALGYLINLMAHTANMQRQGFQGVVDSVSG